MHSHFRLILLCCLLLSSPSLQADLLALLKAKSLSEVKAAEDFLDLHLSYQIACRWELENEVIPAHCYLISNQAGGLEKVQLNKACSESASRERSLRLLFNKLKAAQISSSCKSSIKDQIKVLKYQYQGEI